MKKLILCLFLYSTVWVSAETQTWTSTAGTTLEAELMEYANRTVVLKTASGRKLTLPLAKLVPEDQARITKWAEGQEKVQVKKTQSASNSATGTDNQATLKGGLADLLPENLLDSHGKEVSRNKLAGKTVGFYFSAHWCPPCRTFTPSLVKFRDDNKDDFEIVFVSSDKSPQAQMGYMEETNMKWLTLPHRGKAAKSLADKYGVRGIPALIIVSPDGETITKNGRGDVSGNPKGALASWQKSI
jgi:nucleoredoxin